VTRHSCKRSMPGHGLSALDDQDDRPAPVDRLNCPDMEVERLRGSRLSPLRSAKDLKGTAGERV